MTGCERYTPRQRCSAISIILPSLHGNVAILIYDADIFLSFAVSNNKLKHYFKSYISRSNHGKGNRQ